MKTLIGRALLAKVLDDAAETVDKKDLNQLKTQIQKVKTNKKIRNKFTIDHIMSKFTTVKLKFVKHRFNQKLKYQENGLTLLEFVELMKIVVPYNHRFEEYDFVNGLCILFNEIDINGDGTMEWDEFASFIIEAVDSNNM